MNLYTSQNGVVESNLNAVAELCYLCCVFIKMGGLCLMTEIDDFKALLTELEGKNPSEVSGDLYYNAVYASVCLEDMALNVMELSELQKRFDAFISSVPKKTVRHMGIIDRLCKRVQSGYSVIRYTKMAVFCLLMLSILAYGVVILDIPQELLNSSNLDGLPEKFLPVMSILNTFAMCMVLVVFLDIGVRFMLSALYVTVPRFRSVSDSPCSRVEKTINWVNSDASLLGYENQLEVLKTNLADAKERSEEWYRCVARIELLRANGKE